MFVKYVTLLPSHTQAALYANAPLGYVLANVMLHLQVFGPLQPVLSNAVNVSYSMIERKPLVGLELCDLGFESTFQ